MRINIGRSIILIISVALIFMLAVTLIFDYGSLALLLSRITSAKSDTLIRRIFTPQKLRVVQGVFAIGLLLNGVLFYYWNRIVGLNIIDKSFIKEAFVRWKEIFIKHQVYLVLIIPIASILYFGLTLPVSYDEAWTYSNFSIRSVFSSMAYYPLPNNHVLHSILTNISLLIPGKNQLFLVRLPAMMACVTAIVVSFYFFKHVFGEVKMAYVGSSVMPMMFMGIYYGYMSRGYSLVLLSFIVISYSAFLIIKNERNIYWVIFTIASIAGFYTIPSFLYPFLTVHLFLLIARRRISTKHFVSGVLTIVMVLVLYSPIILLNGIDALVGNKYVKPIERVEVIQRLPSFLVDSIGTITGITPILWLLCLVGGIWFVMKRKYYNLGLYLLICILCPLIFLALHSVIPFSRTFNYYLVIFSICLAISVGGLIVHLHKWIVVIVCMVLQLVLVFNFKNKIYIYEAYAITAKHDTEKIVDGRRFFVNALNFETYLFYELDSRKIKNYSVELKPNVLVNADSMRYDYIIIRKDNDKTVNRGTFSTTPYYNIYK